MLKDILARIDERLELLGLSEYGAALEAGLSGDAIRNIRRAVERGDERRGVSTNTIMKLAPALQTTTTWLLEGKADSPARDLPIRGTAEARLLRGGTFSSAGAMLGYTWRPPMLVGRDNAYAFYVGRTSMEPEFREGQIYVALPDRPPAQGDAVVVVTRDDAGIEQANLGKLVRQDEQKVVIVKREPAGAQVEFTTPRVVSVDRVLTNNELFGT